MYKAVDKKMSWNENYYIFVLDQQDWNCPMNLLALAGLRQILTWNRDVTVVMNHTEAAVFFKMSSWTFFSCLGIMTFKTNLTVSEKSR